MELGGASFSGASLIGGDDARELAALLASAAPWIDCVRLRGELPLLLGPLESCGVGSDAMDVRSLVYGMWKLGGGIAK